MTIDWKKLFTQDGTVWANAWTLAAPPRPQTLDSLRRFLDLVHIRYCLVKPYWELHDYPLVEQRELMPSFEADLWEYKNLPGFSLVAFARPICYFNEVFQFDYLKPVSGHLRADVAQQFMSHNISVMQSRLPRVLHDHFQLRFENSDVSALEHYPALIPFLMHMDRAQVMGLHGQPGNMHFHLAGVYASLPSDLDTEVKRYGLRIGKFSLNDHDSYEKNRSFVLQHLMELYGYPIASERRTSAALFARRLHKMGERFLIRTLGQSDRTLSTMWSDDPNEPYLHVDKVALVRLEDMSEDALSRLKDGGFMVDEKKTVVILKVTYHQHKFSPDNVRQERALSIANAKVIHPITGEYLSVPGLIRDASTMFLRLNDIVRGEHAGRITYKRNEIIENTDTEEKRLKFVYAWLSKHQRRIIAYSDEFFAKIDKVLDNYLFSPDSDGRFSELNDLYVEAKRRYSYIQQARKVGMLEELRAREYKGERIGYSRMLEESVSILHGLKFEIVDYFDSLVDTAIIIGDSMLHDRYLVRNYIEKADDDLTQNGLEIKRNYGKLVALLDEFKAIRKSRTEKNPQRPAQGPALSA
jgi:hypothetical protein